MNAVAIVFIRLSSRASGWITRILLADEVDMVLQSLPVAVALRDLVRQTLIS